MKIRAKFRDIAGTLCVLAGLAATATVAAPAVPAEAATTASFSADYNTTNGTIDTSSLLNASQGGYTTMQNLHWFPEQAGQLSSLGLKQIRIDHVFDDDFYHLVGTDSSGNLTYDFTALDKEILPLVRNGLTPFISLSYTPDAIGPSRYAPPADNTKWAAAVTALVTHYKNLGYTGWSWEVWNEPNGSGFWSGSLAQYEALYTASATAVKAADPTAKIGGAAAASLTGGNWSQNFISYLGANPSVPADFFSYHSYSVGDFSNAATARSWLNAAGRTTTKIYVTEWGNSASMTQGAGSGTDTTSSNGGATFAAKRLYSALGSSVDQAFWFSPVEAYTPQKEFNGDLGLVTVTGHRKAVGNVFDMWSQLDSTRLAATVSGTGTSTTDVYGLATKNASTGKTTVLLWNNTATDSAMSLALTSLPYASSNFSVTQTRISPTEGNYYASAKGSRPGVSENAPVVAKTVNAPGTSYSSSVTVPSYGVTELTFAPTTAATSTVTTSAQPIVKDLAATASGATISASSSYESSAQGWGTAFAGDGQRHSFDTVNAGNPVQGWSSNAHSSASATEYIQSDFGSAKTLDTVTLWPRDSYAFNGAGFPTAFTITGSTDGTNWTSLYSTSNYNNGNTVDGPQTFPFTAGSYRYLRVTATTLGGPLVESGSTVYRFQLAELEATHLGLPNAGFESGSTSPWKVNGSASVSSTVTYTGHGSVTFTGSGKGVQYTATGLTPNTAYAFGAYVKSSADGDPVYLGVKNYGGTETNVPVASTKWTPTWITFTTGSSSTSATVYLYKNSGSAQVWGDDFVLNAA